MTTFYGSKVGSLINSLQSIPLISAALKGGGDAVLIRDTIELNAVATDNISLGSFDWETVINPLQSKFWFDDLGTSCTLSVGATGFLNALCNAQDVATAAGSADIMKSVDVANYFKPLWQIIGHASLAAARAVATKCELLATVNTAAAAGTVTWQIVGRKL